MSYSDGPSSEWAEPRLAKAGQAIVEEVSNPTFATPMDALLELNQINDKLSALLSQRQFIKDRLREMKEAEEAYYQQVFNAYEKIIAGIA